VLDPTENVKALTEAANLRQDDLRDLYMKLVEEKVGRVNDSILTSDKISSLRSDHYKEIRHMESDRVDKIRSVDVANAAATATQLLSAVTTLATTAQATAETLRNQVAATAAAVASQTERVVNPILERVALLEKSSYTGAGKQAYQDPMMMELVAKMNSLLESRAGGVGRTSGISATTAMLVSAVVLVCGLLTIGGFVFMGRSAPAIPPQVIYATPPTATTPR
jgi:hypothetical protein